MHVNKSFETPQGTVTFIGELEPKELDLVLKVGLNFLMQMGALPLVKAEAGDMELKETPEQ